MFASEWIVSGDLDVQVSVALFPLNPVFKYKPSTSDVILSTG
jgi:hypothetical protein